MVTRALKVEAQSWADSKLGPTTVYEEFPG